VTERKPGKLPAKADHHVPHGVLLGYGATTKYVRYFYQTMNFEKLSTHHTIDEAHYGKTRRPPGRHILMDMGYYQRSVVPVITTPPPLSRYPMRSQHKTVTPFLCKLIPLPMNEFTSAPFSYPNSIILLCRNISIVRTIVQ
jgi:hypothetical protein